MSMYVNEVGHNYDLVENVMVCFCSVLFLFPSNHCPKCAVTNKCLVFPHHILKAKSPTQRSVAYYVNIDQPMEKGDSTELLVNYKDHYEVRCLNAKEL